MTSPDARRMEQASRLAAGEPLPNAGQLTVAATRELGWALKGLCYASWSSDPKLAVRAASALRRLRDAAPAIALLEVDALLAWTEGIARAIEGQMEAAIASFDAAAAAFTRLSHPGHAAQTQVPKIMALAMLGRHDDAAHCAELALRALLESDDQETASKVLLNLGHLHLHADRYGAAVDRFREAAVLFSKVGDPEHSVMADIGLADALTATGALDDAVRVYARAQACAAAHGFSVLQALVEESVALLDLGRGRYREALAGLEGSRRRYAELGMPQQLAIAEKQLADAYLDLHLLPESLAGYEAALERFQSLGMQVDRAWTLVQRGRALALAGQREGASASLAEAAPLFAELGNPAGAAAVALAQAELALAGANAEQALALAREAESRFHVAGLKERQLRASAVQAQALLQLGNVTLAQTLFDSTLAAARLHHLMPVELRCLTGRAMAARVAGDRRAARVDLEAATELFEDQRRTLPGDEIRSAFQRDHLLPFRELLRLELEAHAQGDADAADVLAQLDRFRASTLADRLGGADRGASESEGTTQHAGTQDLRTRLAWLYRRLRQVQEEAGATTTVTTELRTTERELLERTRRIRLSEPSSSTPASEYGRLDTRLLQRLLEPGDALVEYGVQDDELFACVVTPAEVHVKRHLAGWQEVIETVRSVRFQVDTLRHGSAPVQRHLPTLERRIHLHLQRLHAMIWQPLTRLLGERRRVLIVPHAQLASVPFGALHDGERCIAERLQIALAPSARLALGAFARRPRGVSRVLALGDSMRLRNAAHEANAVSAQLPEGLAFVGTDATIENLLTHCGRADVIHFACHAQFRSDNPVFSALHLHDGVLTAEAIEALRLPGANIVLSGCETALGDADSGDEMFGLTRAFLVAGASRVLATLWPVDDATTAELMFDFYAGLRLGQSPGAALRRAQMAARVRRAHPFYWASFTLTGRW